MSTRKYILNGHLPWPIVDLIAWAKWYETADRTVAYHRPQGADAVSTIFLALEQVGDDEDQEPPPLFETKVTGGTWHNWVGRVITWDEAEAQHIEVVKAIAAGLPAGEFLLV